MADQEDSAPITRTMMRCTKCRVMQTIGPEQQDARCGACGGDLAVFDWEAHHATLPKPQPITPTKETKKS